METYTSYFKNHLSAFKFCQYSTNEKVIARVCMEVFCTLIPIRPFPFKRLVPNSPVMGGGEGGRWRAVERVTSPTGLCLPAGWAPWSEPAGRSGASCDGILLSHCGLGTLGLRYRRLNVSPPPLSPTPPGGLFLLARGWRLGGGCSGALWNSHSYASGYGEFSHPQGWRFSNIK